MLSWRLILGVLFVAILGGICRLDYHASRPGIYLLPLAILLSLAAAGELIAMWRPRADGTQPLPGVVYVGTALTVLLAGAGVWLPGNWAGGETFGMPGWLAVGLGLSLILAMIGELRRYDGTGRATTNLALTVLAVMYVGGLMGFLVQLRMLGSNLPSNHGQLGMLALVSMITIVKLSDIGQYTAGRMFGSRKLAPKLSPGKTWEGVLGGLLFAVVGGFLAGALAPHLVEANSGIASRFERGSVASIWVAFLYPLCLAAAGIVGDLTESVFKRDAGVKDSSNWLPGFGGVLDLLDSLLGAAPIAFLFWALKLVGA